MWYIHHKLPPARLEALLEGIAPNNEVLIINMSFYLQNNNKKVKFDFYIIMFVFTYYVICLLFKLKEGAVLVMIAW
jgi:hypothetical protein